MCINAGSDANNAYKSMVSSLEMVSAVDAVFGSMEDVHVEDMLGELLVKEKSTSRKVLSALHAKNGATPTSSTWHQLSGTSWHWHSYNRNISDKMMVDVK